VRVGAVNTSRRNGAHEMWWETDARVGWTRSRTSSSSLPCSVGDDRRCQPRNVGVAGRRDGSCQPAPVTRWHQAGGSDEKPIGTSFGVVAYVLAVNVSSPVAWPLGGNLGLAGIES
jgi:hypothetical protein